MWKKIRYVTYFLLLILIFSVTYKFREYYYVPFIQSGINKLVNDKLKFRNFSLSFPLDVTLYNIEYDNTIFVDTATLRFEPLILVKNIKTPLKSLVAVNVDKLAFVKDTPAQKNLIDNNANTNKANIISKFINRLFRRIVLTKIFVNKANILYFDKLLKAVDTEMSLEDKLTVSSNVTFKQHDITLYGNVELKDNLLISDFQILTEGFIRSEFDVNGQFNIEDKSVNHVININNLFVSQLKFGKNKIQFTKKDNNITVNCEGENGKLFFETKDPSFSAWKSNGNMMLTDINDLFKSKLKYTAIKDKSLDISAQLEDIYFLKNNFGKLDVKSVDDNEHFKLDCSHNSDNKFVFTLYPEGKYLIKAYNKENKIGKAVGNYKTGEISIDMKDIPLNKLIFLSSLSSDVKGKISLYGNINSSSGTIKLHAKNLSSKQLKKFDVIGELNKKDSKWFCDIATKDKKLEVKSFFENKKNNNVEFFFSGLNSNNIFKILGWKDPRVSGSASGYIKYDTAGSATKADIKLKNGTFFNNNFKTWNICSDISEKRVNISTFSFNGNDSNINLTTQLDFNKYSPQSFINCDVKNFKIGGVTLNSQINFSGTISDKTDEISGILNAKELKLNKFDLSHTSKIFLSTKQLKIQDIDDNNNLSGDFFYNFKTKKVSANIKAVQSKLSKYYSKVKGRLDLNFSMNGPIKKPKIKADFSISNGLHNNMYFDVNSKIITRNNNTYLEKFKILLDKNNSSLLEASGKLGLQKNDIKIKIKNFSHRNINRFVGFITPFKGTFYGDGTVTGSLNDLSCLLNIYSDEIFVKSIKFNKLNSKIELKKDSMGIKDSTVKLKDSEIKIISGNFNIKTGKYSSIFKLVNTHLGPFDTFGTVDLKGKMIKKLNGSIYTGDILLKNLWLNRQRVKNLPLNYVISNRKFNFETDKKEDLKVKGSINFNKYPNILLENINVSENNQEFGINGSVSSKDIDLKINTKSVDAGIITDIFNLPFDMEGPIDIDLTAKGTVLKPLMDLKATSKKGNIFNISYTSLNINAVSKNNIIDIKEFHIDKKGEYKTSITGTCPFWLDPKLRKKMQDEKINIKYEFTDDKCGLFKEYTQEQIVAKSGKINLKGSLTGTLRNMLSTGELTANISNITTNSYINKIKNLVVDFEWKNNLLEIKKFTAKIGSGIVDVFGNIRLNGLTPYSYDLSISTPKKGIPIVIQELPIPTSGILNMEKSQTFTNFSKAVPTFDFKLYGNMDDLKLVGWAKLENAKFCFPPPVKISKNSDFTIKDIFPNIFINIDLLSGVSTNYENGNVNMYLDGKLNLKGPVDDIVANGILESSEGRVSYIGNDFDIINSKVEIINNEIFITGEGESDVYTAGDSDAETIKVFIDRSSIDDLKIRFASKNDPTMDSKTALSRLTKTDPSKATALDTSTDFLVKQQAIRLLGSSVAMPLANTVLKKTGIVDNVRLGYVNQDNLEIKDDEEPTLAELLYGMKYSVEKNINRLLQVGYSVTFDQVEREIDLKHALEMSFKVSKDLFLKGSYGLKSDNPLYEPEKKVMLEQRLRFGGGKKK